MGGQRTEGSAVVRYVGVAGVAAWFEVSPGTVTKWLDRYAETHPYPKPDAEIGEGKLAVKGWLPEREAEWRAWKAGRPGQGAGGGPKPKR
ncbi:hypothetical protein [Streptosporangium sp. CA-115845]|uniref:hypothetical protein n=1 Tax=Streptosporangium sp. CA-115845 TaxID=3240071 RepID=UPI003D8A6DC9